MHACPLVERGGSSVAGTQGRRSLAAGIRSSGRGKLTAYPTAAWDHEGPVASSMAELGLINSALRVTR